MPQKKKTINNIEVPYMLMGNSAYPLLPWLLTPYTMFHQLTPQEESFNVYLEMGHAHAKTAFIRLRARWQCIIKRPYLHSSFLPHIVAACCVLHNIVETRKEKFMQQWIDAVGAAADRFPQPEQSDDQLSDASDAILIRDTLRDYISKFPL